ncbi:MAG TPA: tetratricopeptide repeat protein [Candidatus Methanoperedens sp.]|nr:tetratricopeptide repeat protein [Candidatus Methanoperedens sp.]
MTAAGLRPLRRGLPALAILALVAVGFAPALRNGFVNLDDTLYVTDNPLVRAGLTVRGVAWAFTAFHGGNWHPLTWISHMADADLFGTNAAGHHAVSILLHAAATLALFAALRLLTGSVWRSALAVSLFALHPLRVESVAWASQRKDALSVFFFCLALFFYARHVRRPGGLGYAGALASFAAGLMAKPVLVTVPALLLLVDFWPLGRIGPAAGRGRRAAAAQALREKVPFFLLAAVSSVLTVLAQRSAGAVMGLADNPVTARAANALVSVARYLRLTVWPDRLAPYYPLRDDPWPLWQVAAALVLVLLVSGICAARVRRQPWLAAGWCWFLVALLPVIGLVQVGFQALADRYTYLPHIGLAVAAAWAVGAAAPRRTGPRLAVAATAALVLVALAVRTQVQVSAWRDSRTLIERALAATGENAFVYTKLGELSEAGGDADRSLEYYAAAARIAPRFPLTQHNYGISLLRAQRFAAAVAPLAEAVRLSPGDAEARYHLGLAYLRLGRAEEASRSFADALRLKPERAAARQGYMEALVALGRCEEAIAASRVARAADPANPVWHFFLAECLSNRGELAPAIEHYREVLRHYPADPDARAGLASAEGRLGAAGPPP